jgi:hypothetical protein
MAMHGKFSQVQQSINYACLNGSHGKIAKNKFDRFTAKYTLRIINNYIFNLYKASIAEENELDRLRGCQVFY